MSRRGREALTASDTRMGKHKQEAKLSEEHQLTELRTQLEVRLSLVQQRQCNVDAHTQLLFIHTLPSSDAV